MCGIAGIIAPGAGQRTESLDRMRQLLAHRGPDGSGTWVRENVALVHTRLAIIDPAQGQQPMQTSDGKYAITFNGEIYNFRELREELKTLGATFETGSDTEVVLHAYRLWGDGCFLRFRGMFALGIYDGVENCVVLARDPFGVKPLVYADTPGGFYFASELNALMQFDGMERMLSRESLQDYFTFGYIPAPATIYRNVHKLEPATILRVHIKDRRMSKHCYWRMSFAPGENVSEESWLEQVDAAVSLAVKRSLVADGPFGLFLSGGIDSSLVASRMVDFLGRDVQAFCIGFSEKDYDESGNAKSVANHLGIPLKVEIMQGNDVSNLEQVVGAYGEPFSDASAVPTWRLCGLARAEFPMVLSGDGGDELFGGYTRFDHWVENNWTDRRGFLLQCKRGRWFRAVDSWRRIRAQHRTGAAWLSFVELFPQADLKELLQESRPGGGIAFQQAHDLYRRESPLSYAQGMDMGTYLPGSVLAKVDIASMGQGLEVRPPLLDLDLAELAGRIPAVLHRDPTLKPGGQGKQLLKKCLGRTMPRELWDRPKKGFGLSHETGFLPGGGLRARLEAVLADALHPLHHVVRAAYVRRLLEEHTQSRQAAPRLWSVLVLATWLNQQRDVKCTA